MISGVVSVRGLTAMIAKYNFIIGALQRPQALANIANNTSARCYRC